MERYRVDSRETSCLINPKSNELLKKINKISEILVNGRKNQLKTKTLVVMMFTGLGIQYDGMQALLYNEFDNKKRIKVFKAEAKVRILAEIAGSSGFIMSIFACDRSVYNPWRN